jgi:hypothetical protein
MAPGMIAYCKRRPARLLVPVVAGACAAGLVLLLSPANGGANTPPKGKHCGLFRAATEWIDAEHIRGYFYSYGVTHMTCHKPHLSIESDPAVIATLAVDGIHHPYGFTCVVSGPTSSGEELHSGYCSRGNPRKPKKVKAVVWGPETECAIPDPPYTPETLPAKCHT